MKKDEKTEKENTAISTSEESNSPEGGKEEKREQSTFRSSSNNSESAPESLSKKNHNFVHIHKNFRPTPFLQSFPPRKLPYQLQIDQVF